jgi:hypothetical protein
VQDMLIWAVDVIRERAALHRRDFLQTYEGISLLVLQNIACHTRGKGVDTV